MLQNRNKYLGFTIFLHNHKDVYRYTSVASFTKEVNPWLAKRPLKTKGRLANLELISLVN